jgi:hypothetical protein
MKQEHFHKTETSYLIEIGQMALIEIGEMATLFGKTLEIGSLQWAATSIGIPQQSGRVLSNN